MTEFEKVQDEIWLKKHGWAQTENKLWWHPEYLMRCPLEIAKFVQKKRLNYKFKRKS